MSISKSITTAVSKMSIEDLRQLNQYVVGIIKESRNEAAWQVKQQLKVHDRVMVNHRKVAGMIGTVNEINRTRCSVTFGHRRFTVPLSMVEIVKNKK